MKTLYYHANIITGMRERGKLLLPGGYLLVEDGVLADVGVCGDDRLPEAQVRHDLAGAIVTPGMISAHCHFYGQFVRGMALKTPVLNWQQVLSRMWWKVDKALDAEQIYYSTVMGLIDGLKAGTTTYFDHQASPNCIDGSLDIIESAMQRLGGRGCLAYEVTDRDGKERANAGIAENVRYLRKHRSDRGAFKGLFGLHASYTLSDETLARCAAEGAALGAGFHIHMAEAQADLCDSFRQYDMGVVERLDRFGILNGRTITAHNVHVGKPQFEIMRRAGITAAHNCQSNTNNAVGCCPVTDLMDAGVHVALGGDGYTYDLFAELGFAAILQHLRTGDCAAFPGAQVLDMAFTNNRRLAAQTFGYDLGVLCKGAAADFLLLDYDPPTPLCEDNVLSHMTAGFSGHVRSVVVGGETVVRDRRLTRADEKELTARCRAQAQRLWDKL